MAIEGFAAADRALSPFSPCCSQPRASRFVFRVPAKREFPLSARSPRSRERRSAMRAADTGDAGRFPRRWWPGMGSALAPRGYACTRGRARGPDARGGLPRCSPAKSSQWLKLCRPGRCPKRSETAPVDACWGFSGGFPPFGQRRGANAVPNCPLVFAAVHPNPTNYWGCICGWIMTLSPISLIYQVIIVP
jgi:hypothetical protein